MAAAIINLTYIVIYFFCFSRITEAVTYNSRNPESDLSMQGYHVKLRKKPYGNSCGKNSDVVQTQGYVCIKIRNPDFHCRATAQLPKIDMEIKAETIRNFETNYAGLVYLKWKFQHHSSGIPIPATKLQSFHTS